MLPMMLPTSDNIDEMVNIFVAVENSIIKSFAKVNSDLRNNKNTT